MPFDAARREEITDNFVEFIEAKQRDERRKRRLRPASTRRGPDDLLSPAGAALIAVKIREFWAAAGYQIKVEVVQAGRTPGGDPIFGVRSDLKAGLPAR